MSNSFENKTKVLSALWMNYREDKNFKDFVVYNDLGLPLAYFIDSNLVTPSDQARYYVEETYDLFITSLGIEDEEFTSLEEMLSSISLE